MESRELKCSRSEVKKAGKVLCGKRQANISADKAVEILENFRSIHIHPMNVFCGLLNSKSRLISDDILISRRLKRAPSIIKKLKLQKNMSLSLMQDLGGVRIVLPGINDVYKMREIMLESEQRPAFKSILKNEDDYIESPKESGYRSLHLVYKYEKNVKPEKRCLIELQLRTKIQHAWATAVEVVGTYLKQPLKQSLGQDKWLDLFKLISKAFSDYERNINNIEIFKKVIFEINNNKLIDILQGFSVATNEIRKTKGKYFLIILDFNKRALSISRYTDKRLDDANAQYSLLEKKYINDDGIEILLVSVDSINNLRKLYPNYFLDTKEFVNIVNIIKNLSS